MSKPTECVSFPELPIAEEELRGKTVHFVGKIAVDPMICPLLQLLWINTLVLSWDYKLQILHYIIL